MKHLKLLMVGLLIALIALPAQPAFAQQSLCGNTYVVQSGDTLRGIAQMCGTTVQSILNLNPGINNANLIYPGQVLNLVPGNNNQQPVPIPNTGSILPSAGAGTVNSPLYIVKPGDLNLPYLASHLKTTVADLENANPSLKSNGMSLGQILVVPGRQNQLPAIAVSPITGVPGTMVRVAGYGFASKASVQIGAGRPGQTEVFLKKVTTDDSGYFSTTLAVPSNFAIGDTIVFVANNPNNGKVKAVSNLFYVVSPTQRNGSLQYLVQPGDTLYYLSRLFGVSIQQIENANSQIPSSGEIIAGRYITIPAPGQGLPGTGGTPQQNRPSIAILPQNPSPGERVFVLATGFEPNSSVEVLLGQPGSPAAVAQTVTAGQLGVVFTSLVVPNNPQGSGPWVVYATNSNGSLSVMSQSFNLGIPSTGGTSGGVSAPLNPPAGLGNATWVDNFDTGTNWLLSKGTFTTATVQNGQMALTANTAADGWRITWPAVSNYYLQATETPGQCQNDDRYGLFVQVPVERNAAQTGYLFGFTCGGQYFLRRWDGGHGTYLVSPTASSAIHSGANATNQIGIAVFGDGQLALYANGQLLTQVTDTTYTGQGRFGLFAGSPTNGNFTVYIDTIAYWNLP